MHADLVWAKQEPQLGTGHALAAGPAASRSRRVPTLVLYGDVPLIRAETLQALSPGGRQGAWPCSPSSSTTRSGYGRIVREPRRHHAHRRGEGRDRGGARASAKSTPASWSLPTARLQALARRLAERQRAGRVLPDRRRRRWRWRTRCRSVRRSPARPGKSWASTARRSWPSSSASTSADVAAASDGGRASRWPIRRASTCAAASSAGATWSSTSTACSRARSCSAMASASARTACCATSSVAAGSRIEPFCHIDEADIGARCRIGPYARLRPGTVLAEDVHIGNFVEVKNEPDRGALQGQPPRLRRRRHGRARRQHRRRHHHLQLRRRQQAPHRHRGRRLHRLRHAAGGAGDRRPGRDAGRRHHADPGCAAGAADRVARASRSPCRAGSGR